MSDLDRTITYVFRMVDNTSQTANQIQQSTGQASQSVQNLKTEEENLNTQTTATTANLQAQQLNITSSLVALTALRGSVSAVTNGMINLGIVSGESAEAVRKINSAFQLFSGAVTAIKAVQGVMSALNLTTLTYSSIMTYLKVLENPLAIAAIGVGVGAAAGVGAYMLTQNNQQNNSQTTINVVDTEPAKQTANQIYYIEGALR